MKLRLKLAAAALAATTGRHCRPAVFCSHARAAADPALDRCGADALARAHGQARLARGGQHRHARHHQREARPAQSAAGRSVLPPLLRRAAGFEAARAPVPERRLGRHRRRQERLHHHQPSRGRERQRNHHHLLDNRTFKAKVVGSDEGADIAVLQAKQPNLVAMALGDSSRSRSATTSSPSAIRSACSTR
jgi:hypothetical protein